MTIGIQGEWGSGKTSLMQLVLKQVEKDSKDTVLTHWFETWQYGASGGGDSLGLLLMRDLCFSLVERVKDERWQEKLREETFGFLKKMGRGVGAAAINTLSAGTANGASMVDELFSSGEGTVDLRDEFRKLVRKSLQRTQKQRVVVFIDDLDRVQPAMAVRMLEVLKNFMDVEQCVFVVACDYDVVREGVRELMNIEEKEKVDAFFHKLFQVPFHMPIGGYSLRHMVEDFLLQRVAQKNTQVDDSKALTQTQINVARNLATGVVPPIMDNLVDMIHAGIGHNPRACKRLLNRIDLACCVEDSLGAKGKYKPEWSIERPKKTQRWLVSLVSVVLMRQVWPELAMTLFDDALKVYHVDDEHKYNEFERRLRTLSKKWPEDLEATPDVLRNRHEDEEVLAWLRAEYGSDIHSDNPHPEVDRISAFCAAWFDSLNSSQVQGELTQEELVYIELWSKRFEQMGSGKARMTGFPAFRRAVHDLAEADTSDTYRHTSDAFVGFAQTLFRFCKDSEDVSVRGGATEREVRFQIPIRGKNRSLLVLSKNMKVTAMGTTEEFGQDWGGIVGLAEVGDRLRAELEAEVGLGPIQENRRGLSLEFHEVHRAERVEALEEIFQRFLIHQQRIAEREHGRVAESIDQGLLDPSQP